MTDREILLKLIEDKDKMLISIVSEHIPHSVDNSGYAEMMTVRDKSTIDALKRIKDICEKVTDTSVIAEEISKSFNSAYLAAELIKLIQQRGIDYDSESDAIQNKPHYIIEEKQISDFLSDYNIVYPDGTKKKLFSKRRDTTLAIFTYCLLHSPQDIAFDGKARQEIASLHGHRDAKYFTDNWPSIVNKFVSETNYAITDVLTDYNPLKDDINWYLIIRNNTKFEISLPSENIIFNSTKLKELHTHLIKDKQQKEQKELEDLKKDIESVLNE